MDEWNGVSRMFHWGGSASEPSHLLRGLESAVSSPTGFGMEVLPPEGVLLFSALMMTSRS